MIKLTCIVCPRGCQLQVDEENNYTVTGNSCRRGEEYGRTECIAPQRTLTTTVPVQNGELVRCPVKTASPIPKEKIWDAMDALRSVRLQAPVHVGDVVLPNIAGTEVDLVACRPIAVKPLS
jgi:CxxC motif-containing protein